MLAKKDPYIDSAYKQLQIISQDREKRLEYEARQKAILDHNQFLLEARQEGLTEGIKIGEQRGEQQGKYKILISLVKDKILTLSDAAQRAGINEEEFKKMM